MFFLPRTQGLAELHNLAAKHSTSTTILMYCNIFFVHNI